MDLSFAKCFAARDYHHINGVYSPLKPKAWADMLSDTGVWDTDSLYLLDGVYNGFKVVDPGAKVPIYDCQNYKSCFDGENYYKMDSVLNKEL